MSTTQDAPADTRTPAQKDYDYGAELFEKQPGLSATKTGALSLMVAALNRQIAELRESKAKITLLVQEQALALADQATEFKTLRDRVDVLTGDTAPAPTIESLIAEIEAAGWNLAMFSDVSERRRSVYIRDGHRVIGTGGSHDSAVAALQEALTTARQAVPS